MDFVTHLPRTPWTHDAIWVIVDQLTKSAHFLTMRMTFTLDVAPLFQSDLIGGSEPDPGCSNTTKV